MRAEQWSQKEDHLHVDDSFSLDPFFLPFSLSVHSYHDNAHAIYFCTLGADCSSSALAAFFSRPLFRRMNLHVDEFVLSVFTPTPRLSPFPWFYLSCLSSRLLWPLIRRFILHLICLSLLSLYSLLAGHGDLGPLRPHEREKWCSAASYWTRETETDRKWAALLLPGETPRLRRWNRGREGVSVSPCLYPDGTGQPSLTQRAH